MADITDPKGPLEISHGEIILTRPFVAEELRRVKITDLIQEFAIHFEGNESEANWKGRQNSMLVLRKLTSTNLSHKHLSSYIVVIKSLHDAIIKAVNSLRTTLSTHGIRLVAEAFEKCGSDFDSIFEMLIHPLIKQCGNTKHQAASEANGAVLVVITHATYTPRILQLISNAMEEKNKGIRGFALAWLDTILSKYSNSKHTLEEKNGAENIHKIVDKGLNDADGTVRGKAMTTYWSYSSVWPTRAEAILEALPAQKQKALLAHQGNPKAANLNGKASSISTTQKAARAATAMDTRSDRPSIRDHIKAHKKKASEKPHDSATTQSQEPRNELADSTNEQRPKSAGSLTGSTAPVKPVRPNTNIRPIPARPKTAAAATTPTIGSLSSAPKRPMFVKKTNTISGARIGGITTDVTSTSSSTVTDQKRGRPLTVIENPPEAQEKVNVAHKNSWRSASPVAAKEAEVSKEPELTSGYVRVLQDLVSDQTTEVPTNAFEVLAKALKSDDVGTRREAVELGVTLHKRFDFGFFEKVPNLESSERDLLLYYIAKRA